MKAVEVVKRTLGKGEEEYDERKVYTSVVKACKDYGVEEERAHEIAGEVAETVTEKVEAREEVLSVEIRMWVRNELRDYDERLANHYYRS